MIFDRGLEDGIEGLAHLRLEPLVDFLLGPEIAVAILHPLEIRGGDAAAVGEDVRHDEDTALVEMPVRADRSVSVTPRWVRNRCQPIAIRDVLAYLVAALDEIGRASCRERVCSVV